MQKIPFNQPYLTGAEERYILQALNSRHHCGNHDWCMKSIELLKEKCGFFEVFLTPSGTAALEMGAILADLGPGDEVIMPSYTFSSTANAVLLQGARPIFCEIEPNTMNIDPVCIEALITEKTKMILPIDYAGIPCDLEKIQSIADKNNLTIMLDAAQSLYSKDMNGKFCGSSTPLAAFSFHETKNIGCGEGGALVVNKPDWIERAHFIQEKGTDRKLVLNGVRSKYGWVDKGSSFLLSDILAAMLYAQLQHADEIVTLRGKITQGYIDLFSTYEQAGCLRIPHPPKNVQINNHAFFVIFDTAEHQKLFLNKLRHYQVNAYIGYVPLHSFSKGMQLGYRPEDLPITEDLASRIVRLPFYTDMANNGLSYALDSMRKVLMDMFQI
jgi:dTDP-4-amino-4,6-dideoxygalactose transaminase